MSLLLLYVPRDPGAPAVHGDTLDIWYRIKKEKPDLLEDKELEEVIKEEVKETIGYKEFSLKDKEQFKQVQLELVGIDNRLLELEKSIKLLEGEKLLEKEKKRKEILEHRKFYLILEQVYVQRIRELEEDEQLFLFMIS